MRTLRIPRAVLVIAAAGLLTGAATFHVELEASFPEEGQVLDAAPTELWLRFNEAPDMQRTSFSVRGPDGRVALGDITAGETTEVIKATVESEMAPGTYTVSWVAAPTDDHPVRGRYEFSVTSAARR